MVSFDIYENEMVRIIENLLLIDENFAKFLVATFNVPFEKVQNVNIHERQIIIAAKTSLGEIQQSSSGEEFIPLKIVVIMATA